MKYEHYKLINTLTILLINVRAYQYQHFIRTQKSLSLKLTPVHDHIFECLHILKCVATHQIQGQFII